MTAGSLHMPEPINLELSAKHLQAIRNELREIKYNAENDRRNVRSQFDNLAATHASQLGEIEARMEGRLDVVETLLGERFGYLDERIGSLDERVGGLEERFGQFEERIGGIETHVGHNAQQMDRLIALVEQIARDK